jgi:hypothetical protein
MEHVVGSNTLTPLPGSASNVLHLLRNRSSTILTQANVTNALALFKETSPRIDIDPSFTEIEGLSFEDQTSISEIIFIGDSQCTTLGLGCFRGCFSLSKLDMTNTKVTTIPSYTISNSGRDVQEMIFLLPSGLQSVFSDGFENCFAKNLVFPSTMRTIGSRGFFGCNRLELLDFSSITSPDVVIQQNAIMYSGTPDTEKEFIIRLPPGLKSIQHDFCNGSGVTNLVIPEGVTTISPNAFLNLSSLETLIIPTTARIENDESVNWANVPNLHALRVPQDVFTTSFLPTIDYGDHPGKNQFVHFYESPYVQFRAGSIDYRSITSLSPSTEITIPFQEDLFTNVGTRLGLVHILKEGHVPIVSSEDLSVDAIMKVIMDYRKILIAENSPMVTMITNGNNPSVLKHLFEEGYILVSDYLPENPNNEAHTLQYSVIKVNEVNSKFIIQLPETTGDYPLTHRIQVDWQSASTVL